MMSENERLHLVELAALLANDNEQAVATIKLLVEKPEEFEEKFADWLYETDFSVFEDTKIIAAYLLTGYELGNIQQFGAYIDWKEETDEILKSLEFVTKNKGYSIDFKNEHFDQKNTQNALYEISNFLKNKGFLLIYWDTDSDSYHLFIVALSDFDKLISLGNELGIKFKKEY